MRERDEPHRSRRRRGGAADDRPVPAVHFVARGHRRALVGIAASAFLGGLAEALFLVTVTRAAFAITDGDDRVGIVAGWFLSVGETLLLAGGLVVARVGLAVLTSWRASRVATDVVARIRRQLGRAFLDASWAVQQDQRSGSLQELLTGYAGQASELMTSVSAAVLAGANLAALMGMAVAVDPAGAAVLVASVALFAAILRPLRRVIRGRARAATHANMQFATNVNEIGELGLELHVFHVQDQAARRLEALIDDSRERARALQFAAGVATPVYTGLAYAALLGALAFVSTSDASDLPSIGATMLVMLRSLSYGQAFHSALTGISSKIPPIEDVQRKLAHFHENRRTDGGRPAGGVRSIAAHDLSFRYGDGPDVLRGISFEIEPNEIVGIVGPSGGGKSTLVQLLLGLRDPTKGSITADGRDIGVFDKAEWARKVTFVPQAAHLIAGSVADNIRFLRDGVTAADIERASRLAHLHDDVAAFPEGYERPVGEHGGHLSGGQQQRLCIARALVEDPDVLILDEPTSALDVRSEHLVRSTLLGLKDRMTVIVIAHRLTTLDICDRIMVIQAGELRGFDTPERLEASSDFYRQALVLSGMR